jgi:hypothetical protein
MQDYMFRPIAGHPQVYSWSLQILRKKYTLSNSVKHNYKYQNCHGHEQEQHVWTRVDRGAAPTVTRTAYCFKGQLGT